MARLPDAEESAERQWQWQIDAARRYLKIPDDIEITVGMVRVGVRMISPWISTGEMADFSSLVETAVGVYAASHMAARGELLPEALERIPSVHEPGPLHSRMLSEHLVRQA